MGGRQVVVVVVVYCLRLLSTLRQDEVIKQHEGNVMMQKDLEAAREEVGRMAKEAGKASLREEELKEEVEKLRQGMHQILESVREQVLVQLYGSFERFCSRMVRAM